MEKLADKNPLIMEVLSLIRIMEETSVQLYKLLEAASDKNSDDSDETENSCQMLFNDLSAGITGLNQCREALKRQLNHACYGEMIENISAVLCDTVEQINNEQLDKAVRLLKYQLHPFLLELREEVYFWGTVFPDAEKMDSYYREEFSAHHANTLFQNELSTYKYKISFFIPVYNKLDYTKQCIDSILKNTDLKKYPCEFILLNDGSYDHTQEYFEELDLGVDKKVIYLQKNVKTMIFSLAMRVCEGEYLLFVNNDTVVTKGWLDNLLLCIESDPAIVSATPCTPNTSNHQNDLDGLYPYTSPDELGHYRNRQDPSLWEERARIMPVIALYRTSLVNRIGLADRLFYTMEFWDDDFSLRARRAGYKQMLCRDTYCYHFGSITGSDAQKKENTLEKGRALFLRKNHADAWGRDFCFDYQAVDFIKSALLPGQTSSRRDPAESEREPVSILGIDCGFGDTLLQIKSRLKASGKKTFIFSVCSERTHAADLSAVSDSFLFSENILDAVDKLENYSFNYIYLSRPLEDYPDSELLLERLHGKLKENGVLLFSVTNLYYKPFLESFLSLSFPDGHDSVRFLNISALQSRLNNMFSQMKCIAQPDTACSVEDFIHIHMKELVNPLSIPLLSSKYLKLCCTK